MVISLLDLNETANEFMSLKYNAVIKDNYDEGRYYCYWLIKTFKMLKDYYPSQYLKYEKLEFEMFFDYISLELIIYKLNKDNKNIEQRKKMLVNLYKIINEKTDNQFITNDTMNFLKNKYLSWQDDNLKIENAFEKMNYILKCIVDYYSKNQLIDSNYAVFILYKLSLLEYAKILIHFLFIQEKIDVENNINSINECAVLGLIYYPINYLLFFVLSYISKNDKERLKYNWIQFSIIGNIESRFLLDGNWLNEKKQFFQAKDNYYQGLSLSLPGARSQFYYSIAKNVHDSFYYYQMIDKEQIIFSNHYSTIAIFYTIIEIDYLGINLFPPKILNKEERMNIILNSYNIIGLNKSFLKDSSGAIETFSEIITKINSDSRWSQYINYFRKEIGNLYVNRGVEYLKLKKYRDALMDFYDSLTYLPDDILSPYLYISECYDKIKDINNKFSVLLRVEKMNFSERKKCEIYRQLVLAYGKINDIRNVDIYSKKYINHISNDMVFYSQLGKIYLDNNKNKKGKYYLDIACNEKHSDAFYYYSIYYQKKNNIKKAKINFSNYIELSKLNMENEYIEINKKRNINHINLYKYRPINKNTIDMLINDYIYFSDIDKLNDPFDCRLLYEYSTNDVFRDVFIKAGLPKIMSLSNANYINELLWSHYSNNHNGLSIYYEIDIIEAYKNKIFLFPINYVDEMKYMNDELFENIMKIKNIDIDKTNYISNINSSLLISTIDKKNSWKYEEEFRLINFKSNKVYKNRIYNIKKIIFGCNTLKNDIETIINIFLLKAKNISINNNKIKGESIDIEFMKLKRSDINLYDLDEDINFNINDYIL